MEKFIVITTINSPTKALKRYIAMRGWKIIIVGDLKTPHREFEELQKKYSYIKYISPKEQEKRFPKLSKLIGWNCIMRRTFGLIEAYQMGAEIIAEVDDDNIPYSFWDKDIFVNKTIEADYYETKLPIFDPLSITNYKHLWHRGFPLELIPQKNKVVLKGKRKIKVLVQAGLWNGDPDVDAIGRLIYRPEVKFSVKEPYFSKKLSVFNSQNTILSRKVIPEYFLFPHIGRMDDIWGGLLMQKHFPGSVLFTRATVYQARNKQNIFKNMDDEYMGYKNTLNFISNMDKYEDYLPVETIAAYKEYKRIMKSIDKGKFF
jgi:hypothetical protein